MGLVNKVKGIAREAVKAARRSTGWSAVRKKHLADNPRCAACGTNKMLQVHHIKPFKEQPELELDPSNLITLCLIKDCHVDIGHGGHYKFYCSDVLVICASVTAGHLSLNQAKQLAKNLRKLNDGNLTT
jgi:hypothetical protein